MSWIDRLLARKKQKKQTQRQEARLCLEHLEDRIVPATKLISAVDPTLVNGSASANGLSTATNQGSVSDDGRYVVYLSDATNLVDGTDNNNTDDVFLYDNQDSSTTLISRKAGESTTTAGNDRSYIPTISGDGKWVAFVSEATDLVSGVTFGGGSPSHVYLYDVVNDSLELITMKHDSTTEAANTGISTATAMPSLSDDGQYLAFISDATNLIDGQTSSRDGSSISSLTGEPPQDAFLYDRLATSDKISMVSHIPTNEKSGGNEYTSLVTVSGDGSTVAFVSFSTNLGQTEDRSSTSPDLFIYDVETTDVTLVTHDASNDDTSAASQADQDFLPPSISDDGQLITYASKSSTLVTNQSEKVADIVGATHDGFLTATITTAEAHNLAVGQQVNITGVDPAGYNGESTILGVTEKTFSFLLFSDPGQHVGGGIVSTTDYDIFLYDASTGDNTLVSKVNGTTATAAGGTYSLLPVTKPVISGDGKYIAFASTATNLLSSAIQNNGRNNVFLYEVATEDISLVSHNGNPTSPADGLSPTISDDGRYVTYTSTETAPDVFRYDRTDGSVKLISNELSKTTASGGIATIPSISGDGSTIVFNSTASNLVADDNNGEQDVFISTDDNGEVKPFISSLQATDILEGQSTTLTGTIGNASPSDTFTVTIQWGDGASTVTQVETVTGTSFTFTRLYLDDNPTTTSSDQQTVTVTIQKGDCVDTESTTFIVTNVKPTVTLSSASSVNENESLTLTGTIVDPGILDTHTVVIDWDDPNSASDSTFNLKATNALQVNDTIESVEKNATMTITNVNGGTVTFTVQHQYLDDGEAPRNDTAQDDSTISVIVSDDDSGVGSATRTVTVLNVAPKIDSLNVSNIKENEIATLTGTFTDPGLLDTHVVKIDWDDPNSPVDSTFNLKATKDLKKDDTVESVEENAILTITDVNGGMVSFSVQHQYLDDGKAPGNDTAKDSSTISVTVSDDDLGTVTKTVSLDVENVAPTIDTLAVLPINENGVATLTGSFTDPGLLDEHTVEIDWKDLNSPAKSTFKLKATKDLKAGDKIASQEQNATLTITEVNGGTVSFSVTHQYLDDGKAPGNGTAQDTSDITVTVRDDDTGLATDSVELVVKNVAPTVDDLTAVEAVVDENGVVTLTGTIVDVGTLDAFDVSIDWGDESQKTEFKVAANARTFSKTHRYLDDTGLEQGKATIKVTVTDDDTGKGEDTVVVTVKNVAPTVGKPTLDPLIIDEGELVTLTGNFTDPGLQDSHKVVITWDDLHSPKSTFNLNAIKDLKQNDVVNAEEQNATLTIIGVNGGTVSFTVQHQYLDDDPTGTISDDKVITVTVTDDDGGVGKSTVGLTVRDVKPEVALIIPEQQKVIFENDVLTIGGTFTDPGILDTHQVVITWDDLHSPKSTFNLKSINDLEQNEVINALEQNGALTITGVNGGTVSFTVQHQYLDDDPSVTVQDIKKVTVTVTDDDTLFGFDSEDIIVRNLPPTLEIQVAPLQVNEGGIVKLTGQIADIGTKDTFKVGVTWGDGTVIQPIDIGALKDFEFFHQYLDDRAGNLPDVYEVVVTVIDDDNGEVSKTANVGVNNVAPTIANLNATFEGQILREGDVVTLTGDIIDPGVQDTFILTIDWGDGFVENLNLPAGAKNFRRQHRMQDDNPTNTPFDDVTINVAIVDDDRGARIGQAQVRVFNVNPTITGLTVSNTNEGGQVEIAGLFVDPGLNDTHSVIVNWGDGNLENVALAAGKRDFKLMHRYVDDDPTQTPADNYDITVQVVDDDGGFHQLATETTVTNVAPEIQNLELTNSNENSPAKLTGTIVDPGIEDTFTLTATWGDGDNEFQVFNFAAGTTDFEVEIRIADDNPTATAVDQVTVSVKLEDDDTGVFQKDVNATVSNVAPTLEDVTAPDVIEEEAVARINGRIVDPGIEDTFTLNVRWGTIDEERILIERNGEGEFTATVVGATENSSTVELTDDSNADRTFLDFVITRNLSPDSVPVDAFGGEGLEVTLTVLDDDNGDDTATVTISLAPPPPGDPDPEEPITAEDNLAQRQQAMQLDNQQQQESGGGEGVFPGTNESSTSGSGTGSDTGTSSSSTQSNSSTGNSEEGGQEKFQEGGRADNGTDTSGSSGEGDGTNGNSGTTPEGGTPDPMDEMGDMTGGASASRSESNLEAPTVTKTTEAVDVVFSEMQEALTWDIIVEESETSDVSASALVAVLSLGLAVPQKRKKKRRTEAN